MKTYKVTSLFAIVIILFSNFTPVAGLVTDTLSVNNYLNLRPVTQRILQGGTGGQPLANLFVKDQTTIQDDPDKYITFTTPNEISRVVRIYRLPANIPQNIITDLRLRVNYRGPTKSTQTWSWYAYDWNTKTWTKIGDNASVTEDGWKMLTFVLKNPQQYINSNHQIRLLTKSNNATGNAKLDYESIRVTYPCFAQNNSDPTPCAEEDNINVPIFGNRVSKFIVTATHPRYDVGIDNCNADFSGCNTPAIKTSLVSDACNTLADDGMTVVQGCNHSSWWRPYKMEVIVDAVSGEFDYLVLYRKIKGENRWPQFFVLYEDGNMRLKAQPPGQEDTCFGSSVIVGPAVDAKSKRPYVDIQTVQVDISALTFVTLDLTYRNGGTANIRLTVDRSKASALVNVNYKTSINTPFVIFRSMYVSDGNSDVDHVKTLSGNYPILNGWTSLEDPWWFFNRKVRSTHNTSAPNIRIKVLE